MSKSTIALLFIFTTGPLFAGAPPFQATPQQKVPKALRSSYELLISPNGSLEIGSQCGFAGKTMEGLVAIRKLAKARRIDLIRNVLSGPNPGGRVYAAQALLELERRGSNINAGDKEKIRKITSSKITLTVCYGCLFSTLTAKEILDSETRSPLRGVSIFEDIEKNP